MDIQKTRVRADLEMEAQRMQFITDIERMVGNYAVMNVLDDKQSALIMGLIDNIFPEPTPIKVKREGNIIYFPGTWEESPKIPEPPKPQPHIGDYLYEQGIHFRANLVWALQDLGAYNLETIAALSVRELASRRGIGKKSIDDLRAFLQSRGLDLKGETT
jgi:hypothetical protein